MMEVKVDVCSHAATRLIFKTILHSMMNCSCVRMFVVIYCNVSTLVQHRFPSHYACSHCNHTLIWFPHECACKCSVL